MNKIKAALLIILLTLPMLPQAQVILKEALSERVVNYKMNVELDTDAKTITGEMVINWKNPSQDTVDNLQFHMYLNAFKNSKSTFFNEGSVYNSAESEWGYVNINSIKTANGNDLSRGMQYIQPDDEIQYRDLRLPDESPVKPDDRKQDQTVLYVPLDEPVLPDSSIQVLIQFTSKLPKLNTRTGYADNYFFAAQWFPKLGVYEPAGMRYAT